MPRAALLVAVALLVVVTVGSDARSAPVRVLLIGDGGDDSSGDDSKSAVDDSAAALVKKLLKQEDASLRTRIMSSTKANSFKDATSAPNDDHANSDSSTSISETRSHGLLHTVGEGMPAQVSSERGDSRSATSADPLRKRGAVAGPATVAGGQVESARASTGGLATEAGASAAHGAGQDHRASSAEGLEFGAVHPLATPGAQQGGEPAAAAGKGGGEIAEARRKVREAESKVDAERRKVAALQDQAEEQQRLLRAQGRELDAAREEESQAEAEERARDNQLGGELQEASEEAEEYEEVAERYQQERAETEQALEQQQEQSRVEEEELATARKRLEALARLERSQSSPQGKLLVLAEAVFVGFLLGSCLTCSWRLGRRTAPGYNNGYYSYD